MTGSGNDGKARAYDQAGALRNDNALTYVAMTEMPYRLIRLVSLTGNYQGKSSDRAD